MKWEVLKKFADIKLIKSMYIWLALVPIAARLLENIDRNITLHIFDYALQLNTNLPFSWTLFFFSALSFSMASVIYFIWCPKLIVENNSYADFQNANRNNWHLAEYAFSIGLNREKLSDLVFENDAASVNTLGLYDVESVDLEHQKVFHVIREYANFYNQKARRGATSFYFFGLLLMAIVLFQNIMSVVYTIHLF